MSKHILVSCRAYKRDCLDAGHHAGFCAKTCVCDIHILVHMQAYQ